MELIGQLIALVLTLMVFSYIVGDNILFRLASHIFVGVAIGYAIIVVIHEVFIPTLSTEGFRQFLFPALLISALLLLKLFPTQNVITNSLGNMALAFVLGVGAALALGGALFGTLLPQTAATMLPVINPFGDFYATTESQNGLVEWLNDVIIVLGTVGTLFYFTFSVRSTGLLGGLREGTVRFFAGMGRLMIIFTLGALFANTFSSRVALLISRLQFLTSFFGG